MSPRNVTSPYDETFSAAYEELRRLARKLKKVHDDPTLNATALVHEAYIKLAGAKRLNVESSQHLKYIVVRAMKQVLIDAARRKAAAIHGGSEAAMNRVSLDDHAARSAAVDPRELLAVGLALEELAQRNDLQARVFEFQFFGGLEVAEIATLIGVSEKKVQRTLRLAKAKLAVALDTSKGREEHKRNGLDRPQSDRRTV